MAWEFEDADLSPREYALYSKLHASAADIAVARSCAAYIRKKGWHSLSFLRRGSVPIQQISFTTTMIVAYARPFAAGRGNIKFPERLLRYEPKETKFHELLLTLRNKEYAHTDASNYKVRPLKGDYIKSIDQIRDVFFTTAEIELFLTMTAGLDERIRERMDQVRTGGSSRVIKVRGNAGHGAGARPSCSPDAK